MSNNNNNSNSNNNVNKNGSVSVTELENTGDKTPDVVSQTPPVEAKVIKAPDTKINVEDKAPNVPNVATTNVAAASPVAEKVHAEPVVNSTIANTQSLSVAGMYMRDYIARYLTINTGVLDTSEKRKQAIVSFQMIMSHATQNPTPEVLDQVVEFFSSDKRSLVLTEMLALQGIDRYSHEDQMKISIFYQIFYQCTDPARRGKKIKNINLDQARTILKSDMLINYLIMKFSL